MHIFDIYVHTQVHIERERERARERYRERGTESSAPHHLRYIYIYIKDKTVFSDGAAADMSESIATNTATHTATRIAIHCNTHYNRKDKVTGKSTSLQLTL